MERRMGREMLERGQGEGGVGVIAIRGIRKRSEGVIIFVSLSP